MRTLAVGLILIAALAAGPAAPADRDPAPPQPAREIAPTPRTVLPRPGRPSPAAATLRDLGYVEIPLSRMTSLSGSGGFLLDVRVNDHPVRMLLDTGAQHTTVDRAWAKAAGLTVRAAGKAVGAEGNVDAGSTERVELSVGGLTVPAELSVIDMAPGVAAMTAQGVPAIDGLLGDSFLNYFAAVIDYPGSRLYLLPPHLQVPTELAGTWRGVREERDGKPVDPPSEWWVQFSAGQVQLTQDGVTLSCRPTFDTSVGPKAVTLDLVINRKPVSYPGVYAVEGGRLRLCLRTDGPGGGRPTGFATKPGDGCVYLEFERDPPADQ